MSVEKKNLFIICPIKEEGSLPRKRSDQLMRHIIKSVAESKYDIIRSDNASIPGRIDKQIINHLKNDDLVVCDLTDHNANVLYELAIRHAIRKPVILMGEKDTKPPFDLYSQRVISYDLTDPDKIEESKVELKKQIEAIEESKFIVDTPIEGTEPIYQERSPEESDIMPQLLNILKSTATRINNLEEKINLLMPKEKSSTSTSTFTTVTSTPYMGLTTVSPLFTSPPMLCMCQKCGAFGVKGSKCDRCGEIID